MARKTAAKPARSKTKKPTKTATTSKAAARAKPAGPSPKQQFLDAFTREHATTTKVLRAFPKEQSEFRPHPRSKSARELAFTFVMEQGLITKALTNSLTVSGGGMPKPPDDFNAILEQFDKEYAALVALIKKTPEDEFNTTVKFFTGPGQMGDIPKMGFAWFMLLDQVHHRGQCSVYLRMAGGKVPSIYGPSADEPWM